MGSNEIEETKNIDARECLRIVIETVNFDLRLRRKWRIGSMFLDKIEHHLMWR